MPKRRRAICSRTKFTHRKFRCTPNLLGERAPPHWACTHLSGHPVSRKQKEEKKGIEFAVCGRSERSKGRVFRSSDCFDRNGSELKGAYSGERHLVITWMSHARTTNPGAGRSISLFLSRSQRSSWEGPTSASPRVARRDSVHVERGPRAYWTRLACLPLRSDSLSLILAQWSAVGKEGRYGGGRKSESTQTRVHARLWWRRALRRTQGSYPVR